MDTLLLILQPPSREAEREMMFSALQFLHLHAMLLSLGGIYNTHQIFSMSSFSPVPDLNHVLA